MLRRTVTAEVFLGVLVLAVTAVLVNVAPARVQAGVDGPFVAEATLGRYELQVLVEPNRVGRNVVRLVATTPEGPPADEIDALQVLFRMPERDIGPIPVEAVEHGDGEFRLHDHQLSVPGQWELEVIAVVDRFTDVRTTVDVAVNP